MIINKGVIRQMPLYKFYCKECDYEFDNLVSLPEREKTRCPKCNSLVKVMVTAPGMINIKGFNAENGYSKKKE